MYMYALVVNFIALLKANIKECDYTEWKDETINNRCVSILSLLNSGKFYSSKKESYWWNSMLQSCRVS